MEGNLDNKRHRKVGKEVKVSDNSLVTKSNHLIEARYRLSLREQRFILLMVSMIEPGDSVFTYYKVPSKQLIEALGLGKEKDAYKRLKQIVRGLQTRLLQIKHPEGVVEVQWVGSADYRKAGIIEFEFSTKLMPYLLQLQEQFTKYRLKNIVQLQSVYAIRIYELLKQYEKIGSRRMTVEDFRAYLGIEETKYKMYANLKDRVLKPAQKEVNEKTDISFTFDEIKRGRKVVELRFTIKPNKPKQSLLPAPDAEAEPTMVKEMRRAGVSRHQADKIWREQWDFLDKEARETVDPLIAGGLQFDQYVREKLFLLESAQKQKKVPSTGGYLRDAIKHNWTSGDQKTRQKKAQRKAHFQQRVQEEEEKRQREDDRLRQERQRKAQLEGRYLILSPETQAKINQQVYEQMLTASEFSQYRGEVTQVFGEIDSGASFFEKLPSGIKENGKLLMRKIVEAKYELFE